MWRQSLLSSFSDWNIKAHKSLTSTIIEIILYKEQGPILRRMNNNMEKAGPHHKVKWERKNEKDDHFYPNTRHLVELFTLHSSGASIVNDKAFKCSTCMGAGIYDTFNVQ